MAHRLTNKDMDRMVADCEECGPQVAIVLNDRGYARCRTSHKKYRGPKYAREHNYRSGMRSGRGNRDYIAFKGRTCERCGFEATDPCQLDVDHIDEDRTNNRYENLRTLCANCHRLRTNRPDLFEVPPTQGQ